MTKDTNQPFFSIFIPTKGRPQYIEESLQSILLQNFNDFEVVVSNNGADGKTKQIIEDYKTKDNKLVYLEYKTTLNMPDHWEDATKKLKGQYILIVTDRCLLKQGTLSFLHNLINEKKQDASFDIITWNMDLYLDDSKILLQKPYQKTTTNVLNSQLELEKMINGEMGSWGEFLPRGMNSCIKKDVLVDLRRKYFRIFRSLAPDFTCAFLCLLNSEKITYINQSLYLSRGTKVSNGGISYSGDGGIDYIESLKISDPFSFLPAKTTTVINTIHQDFLNICNLCNKHEISNKWSKVFYYKENFKEIEVKYSSLKTSMKKIKEIDLIFLTALSKESTPLINEVNEYRLLIKKKRISRQVKSIILTLAESLFNSTISKIRRILIVKRKKGEYYSSALKAAGF